MLPFVFVDPRRMLGISPWAVCVVAGAWIGTYFAERRARRLGYDVAQLRTALVWVVATGFILGHLLDVAFYHPDLLGSDPVELLHIFNGQSSCGGFLGAVLGGWLWTRLYLRRSGLRFRVSRREKPLSLLPFADVITSTFPITWAFARLGCALVHDHPGRLSPTRSWLSLAWPTGPFDGPERVYGPIHVVWGSTARYDLGLVECAFTAVLAAGLALTWRRRTRTGFYVAAVCLTYAPVRFVLDFLRVTGVPEADARYASLTFAQWFCFVLAGVGIATALRMRRLPPTTTAEASGPLLRVTDSG